MLVVAGFGLGGDQPPLPAGPPHCGRRLEAGGERGAGQHQPPRARPARRTPAPAPSPGGAAALSSDGWRGGESEVFPLAGAAAAAPRGAREWRHAARQRDRQPRRHGPRRLRQPHPHRRDPGRRQTCAVQAGPHCYVYLLYVKICWQKS